jgi:hypothetical protein
MSKEWPLEGDFECGGLGLFVTTDCLGRAFTSRTANYDLIIGLPQLDTVHQPGSSLLPPQWTYGPRDESERAIERDDVDWGLVLGAPETAMTFRCRFYTSLTASTDEEFDSAAGEFLNEFRDWWTRFTSWVGILTSQDFVGLGGYAGPEDEYGLAGSVTTWTCNADGQRARTESLTYERPQRIPVSPLALHDLQACVTATGNQETPPEEWLFIRDARSLLNASENRRAVVDAATAAEIAMTTLIDKCLDTANADETVRKALLDRYTALGGALSVAAEAALGIAVSPAAA